MKSSEFIEKVFEIAFGEDAIHRNFTYEDVLETLEGFSERALLAEQN